MNAAAPLWAKGLAKAAALAADVLLPGRCLRCGVIVSETGALCSSCWETMAFIAAPQCDRCGQPFEVDPASGVVCATCIADPPAYQRARAVFRYDDASRALILRFKHGDRTGAAPHFARWMVRAGGDLMDGDPVFVPVPLHPWRLWRRRYNQAAILAVAIARQAGKTCVPDALVRIRATPSQGRLGRGQRRRNVKGAFRLKRPEAVEGKRIVLVDDVLTTGATVDECVRILQRGHASQVDVLTLARVVLTPDFEIAENTLYS
ncbi:MAG TPA: ComF family protein [Hyphomonadaceae bacterium]|nr:ComF family protein [Hyphomonadaceae bacterium]